MALGPKWVHNVPSKNRNEIQKSNEGNHKKVKETTKERLPNHNFDGQGRSSTVKSDPELKFGRLSEEQGEEVMLTGKKPQGKLCSMR